MTIRSRMSDGEHPPFARLVPSWHHCILRALLPLKHEPTQQEALRERRTTERCCKSWQSLTLLDDFGFCLHVGKRTETSRIDCSECSSYQSKSSGKYHELFSILELYMQDRKCKAKAAKTLVSFSTMFKVVAECSFPKLTTQGRIQGLPFVS